MDAGRFFAQRVVGYGGLWGLWINIYRNSFIHEREDWIQNAR